MPAELGIRFDMRAPDWAAPRVVLYREAREMAQSADRIGVDVLLVGEHHACPDGYTSAPVVVAAARTSAMRVRLRALLAPPHDPVHLAEQLMTLDVLTGGRVEAVLGLGYALEEFAMFGVAMPARVDRLERALIVLQDALAGRPITVDGREGTVTPLPVNPDLPIYLGGGVPAAARRAARFGVGLAPLMPDDELLVDLYVRECARSGISPAGCCARRSITRCSSPKIPTSLGATRPAERRRLSPRRRPLPSDDAVL